jgi:bacteriocin biosynthesis cyclodehydratase domain-containing protein
MCTMIEMGTTSLRTPVHRDVHLCWEGDFGSAVARYLAAALDACETSDPLRVTDIERKNWPAADIEILVLSCPRVELCSRLNDLCFELGRPLIPVFMQSQDLCVGPVIVPGKPGCWRCWQRRSAQHSLFPVERSALLCHYSEPRNLPPLGYLEPIAMLAALQVARLMERPGRVGDAAGFVWKMDVFSGNVSTGRLVGVDGCPNCGSGRAFETRSCAQLREALQSSLPEWANANGPRK